MQKQAHMGDQAGSSRDVDAPAAPPRHRGLLSAASPSASNARRLLSLPSCMLQQERERERERESRWALPPGCPHHLQKSGGRSDGVSPAGCPPSSPEVTERERKITARPKHHKGQITASLIRIRKQPNAPRDYCKN